MNKRIILVGPTCSGKTYLRKRFEDRGFKCDVSYTTRKPREGEEYGVHYKFISEDEFTLRISQGAFYEHVQYNGNRYGTGLYEWNTLPLFIMETDGIKHIKPEDRNSCFVIYLDIPRINRQERMIFERGWNQEEVAKRTETDYNKFKDFKDYDLIITDPNF
jgi:guanylate kinase